MGYEDFTGYTVVEPDSIFTITSPKVIFTNIDRNFDAYLYKDKSSGHFGDFEHKFEFKATAMVHASIVDPWIMTNSPDDGANVGGLIIFASYSGTLAKYRIDIYEAGEPRLDATGYIFLLNTTYYITVSRVGTTFTVVIRSGSHEGSIMDTLTGTVATTTYQYIEVTASYNSGHNGYDCSGYVENLDLQEALKASSSIVPIMETMGMI